MGQILKYIIAMIIAFFAPVWAAILAVGLAIAIDTLLGIIYACRQGTFSSSKLKAGAVPKMILYQIVILTIFAIDKFLLFEFTTLFHNMPYLVTKLTALALVSIELISMGETFEKIFGIKIIYTLRKVFRFTKELKKELNDESSDREIH